MTRTQIMIDAPVQVTRHARGRRPDKSKASIASRLQAAFGAFVAPERLSAAQPPGNDNSHSSPGEAASLSDPLALPPDWHSTNAYGGGDLLSLSFLPFDR